ncbi:hypothetical protein EW146_g1598 [Bondarzewia mesenterica]|uniref:SAM-dependent MTase RsmB/NOP-type domain-containing protein n=1 Tax=Bondarzewia mesenterica TaxID=1095465 RepID=A0A4S4M5M1_9AGAM|nr:hypothetical protein EW146_g1598 [Bondarzewia mesenterica]
MDKLREPLPTTFRVAGSRQTAMVLKETIEKTYVPQLASVVFEDEPVGPPVQLSWYPDGLAWQLNVPKKVLRKSPEFKKFHSFLVFETEVVRLVVSLPSSLPPSLSPLSRARARAHLGEIYPDKKPSRCCPPSFSTSSRTIKSSTCAPHPDPRSVSPFVVPFRCSPPTTYPSPISPISLSPSPRVARIAQTAQLLEALHSTECSVPPGLLIANDSDYKRTHLLIHQSARLPSPCFMVTNVDASIFPALRLPFAPGQDSEAEAEAEVDVGKERKRRRGGMGGRALLFDRILCDVPCSGDGTLRKNVGIWKYWNPMDGNGLHGLQLRILQRAMRMLHPEGRIVYSTCSLNPVENEAVVTEALRIVPGFELVDVSEQMPTLVRRPGLTAWVPAADRDLTFLETYDAYMRSLPETKCGEARLGRSHWPPAESELGALHLERCMRVYPHLQDTGGFFVAVLRRKEGAPNGAAPSIKEGKRVAEESKVSDERETKKMRLGEDDGEDVSMTTATPPGKSRREDAVESGEAMDEDDAEESEPTEPSTPAPDAPATASAPAKDNGKGKGKGKEKQSGDGGFKESPYTFVAPDDPIVQGCIRQLSLTPTFPSSNILVRNPAGEPARSLYLTNDLVHAVLQSNDFKRMRLMTAGTKIFTKHEGVARAEASAEGRDTPFRLLSEGLPAVLPYVQPESIVDACIADLRTLLEDYYPLVTAFGEPFREALGAKPMGSHVVKFKEGSADGGASLTHDLVLPIWKSATSVSLMIDKKAKSALSLRVFGEDLTVAGREAAQKQAQKQARTASEAQTTTAISVEATPALDAMQEEEDVTVRAVEAARVDAGEGQVST